MKCNQHVKIQEWLFLNLSVADSVSICTSEKKQICRKEAILFNLQRVQETISPELKKIRIWVAIAKLMTFVHTWGNSQMQDYEEYSQHNAALSHIYEKLHFYNRAPHNRSLSVSRSMLQKLHFPKYGNVYNDNKKSLIPLNEASYLHHVFLCNLYVVQIFLCRLFPCPLSLPFPF